MSLRDSHTVIALDNTDDGDSDGDEPLSALVPGALRVGPLPPSYGSLTSLP